MSFTKKEKNILTCIYFTSIVLQIQKKKKKGLLFLNPQQRMECVTN